MCNKKAGSVVLFYSYSQINYYNGTLVTARGLEFASQAMAFVTVDLGAGKHPSPLEKKKKKKKKKKKIVLIKI